MVRTGDLSREQADAVLREYGRLAPAGAPLDRRRVKDRLVGKIEKMFAEAPRTSKKERSALARLEREAQYVEEGPRLADYGIDGASGLELGNPLGALRLAVLFPEMLSRRWRQLTRHRSRCTAALLLGSVLSRIFIISRLALEARVVEHDLLSRANIMFAVAPEPRCSVKRLILIVEIEYRLESFSRHRRAWAPARTIVQVERFSLNAAGDDCTRHLAALESGGESVASRPLQVTTRPSRRRRRSTTRCAAASSSRCRHRAVSALVGRAPYYGVAVVRASPRSYH